MTAIASRLVNLRPPRIALAFLAGATLLHLLWPADRLYVFSMPALAPIPALVGFGTMMQAWWQFRERENAICPTAETTVLITDGIYRFTRNPMYLGMLLMLFALALFVGTLPYYAVVCANYLIIDIVFVDHEERKLTQLFHEDFERYARKVRRWI